MAGAAALAPGAPGWPGATPDGGTGCAGMDAGGAVAGVTAVGQARAA